MARRESRSPRTRTRVPRVVQESHRIAGLLDDSVDEYSVTRWRNRNRELADSLAELGLFDFRTVPREAHRHVTESLIQTLNGAASDPQNGGHLRAQNEIVIQYGIAAGLSPRALTVALEAGFIHDLNKAIGEPLRQDEFAVLDDRGRKIALMTSMAELVGLNHLGERTRSALAAATRLPSGGLEPEVARAIDLCIVHHGLGSSRFIQDLVAGKNPWWGASFVDPETGRRKLFHPEPPPWTLESIIHDLADSTQQMQAGAAWLMKYPAGFWRASGRSLRDMLSSADMGASDGSIPLSLRLQIDVEAETCEGILRVGSEAGLLGADALGGLRAALAEEVELSKRWVEDGPEALNDPQGRTVYHDVGASLGISPLAAHDKLSKAIAGSFEAGLLEPLVWASGRRMDALRGHVLTKRVCAAATARR